MPRLAEKLLRMSSRSDSVTNFVPFGTLRWDFVAPGGKSLLRPVEQGMSYIVIVLSIFLAMGCTRDNEITNKQQTLVIIKNTEISKDMREEIIIGTVKPPYSYGCIDAFNKSKKIKRENGKKITEVEFLIPKICLQTETLDSARTLHFKNDSLAEIGLYYSHTQGNSIKNSDTLIINNVSTRSVVVDE